MPQLEFLPNVIARFLPLHFEPPRAEPHARWRGRVPGQPGPYPDRVARRRPAVHQVTYAANCGHLPIAPRRRTIRILDTRVERDMQQMHSPQRNRHSFRS